MNGIINKTMDRKDLELPGAKKIIYELNDLIKQLNSRNLKISSWYGVFDLKDLKFEQLNRGYNYEPLTGAVDDKNFPWFLYWEIVWLVLNNNFKEGQRILDIGGSSSLMSYYLASKGVNVVTIDLQQSLVENANYVAKEMNWSLENYVMDARKISLGGVFDHIISVCVFEHIPINNRVDINRKIKDLLTINGTFSITIDYKNPSNLARIDSPAAIENQFVAPSGLRLVQNKEFFDNEERYLLHPFFHKNTTFQIKKSSIRNKEFRPWEFFSVKQKNDYTFASVFLRKSESSRWH